MHLFTHSTRSREKYVLEILIHTSEEGKNFEGRKEDQKSITCAPDDECSIRKEVAPEGIHIKLLVEWPLMEDHKDIDRSQEITER